MRQVWTAESVTQGHPDKVADYIADAILDAHVAQDPSSHVACEVLCKDRRVVLAGEITSRARVDLEAAARDAVRDIGYTDPEEPFAADTLEVLSFLSPQAAEIGHAVGEGRTGPAALGAGDQGIMVGYATDETDALMPLPLHLAHRLAMGLRDDRESGVVDWLRPDGKTQVSVAYDDGRPVEVVSLLVSTQHREGIDGRSLEAYVRDRLAPRALGHVFRDGIEIVVNPSGSFVQGGPSADCGLTGRKPVVDTYGPQVPHGGGAFSGKDATKVDRTGAYFCRYVARQIVRHGLARRVQVQVAYAIGRSRPFSLAVETYGTGDPVEAARFLRDFDFRPALIIERLGLRRPIYRGTTNYGHFGRPGLPWESDSPKPAAGWRQGEVWG